MAHPLAHLERAHEPGRHPRKRPTTGYVYIPAALAQMPTGSGACLERCIACRLMEKPQRGRTPPRLSSSDVAALAYRHGYPLKVLLAILRWARPYSMTLTREGTEKQIFNATHVVTLKALASESMSPSSRSNDFASQRAIRYAVRRLEERGLLQVFDRPGHASFYAPHARGDFVQVPQYLWCSPLGKSDQLEVEFSMKESSLEEVQVY